MQIVKIQIKNFLSITDVEVKPGQINQIVGSNNMGKTSILKAIEIAYKGSTDPALVKHGTDQAEIIIEFSDGMNLHRRLNSDGSQSVKVSKNEMEAKSPQAFLNGLFENSAFNPLELLEPKRRAEALLQAIPIKVTQEKVEAALSPLPATLPPADYNQHGLKVVQLIHDYFYARRAEANKIAKGEEERTRVMTEQFNNKPQLEEALNTEEGLIEKRTQIQTQFEDVKNAEHALISKKVMLHQAEKDSTRMDQELAVLREKVSNLEAANRAQHQRVHMMSEELKNEQPVAGAEQLQQVLATIETERRILSQHRERALDKNALDAQVETARKVKQKAEDFDRCVNTLRTSFKEQIMAEAELPIPGITYKDGEFYFNTHAISTLSTSASMKLACAIARSLAKKSKIICLDGAEALDENSYAELHKEIENDGFTYFVSKVGEQFKGLTNDHVVVMSEGQVVS